MDGTSFENNEEPFVDASGNATSQGAVAMFTAKDGGEVRCVTAIVMLYGFAVLIMYHAAR